MQNYSAKVETLEKEIYCAIRRNRNIEFLTWLLAHILSREKAIMK